MDWSLIQFNWILIQNSIQIQLKKIWMQIGVKLLKYLVDYISIST
jgi:hypothetical protein